MTGKDIVSCTKTIERKGGRFQNRTEYDGEFVIILLKHYLKNNAIKITCKIKRHKAVQR